MYKNTKFLVLITMVVGMVIHLSAEPMKKFKSSLNLGFNRSHGRLSEGVTPTKKYGINFGVNTDYYLTKQLYLSTGLNYVKSGYILEEKNIFTGQKLGQTNVDVNYLDIPLYVGFKFNGDYENFILYGGPKYSFKLSDKIETEGITSTVDQEVTSKLGFTFGMGYLFEKVRVDFSVSRLSDSSVISRYEISQVQTLLSVGYLL